MTALVTKEIFDEVKETDLASSLNEFGILSLWAKTKMKKNCRENNLLIAGLLKAKSLRIQSVEFSKGGAFKVKVNPLILRFA